MYFTEFNVIPNIITISVRDCFHCKFGKERRQTPPLEQAIRTVTTEMLKLPEEGCTILMYHVFLIIIWYIYYKIDHIVYVINKYSGIISYK